MTLKRKIQLDVIDGDGNIHNAIATTGWLDVNEFDVCSDRILQSVITQAVDDLAEKGYKLHKSIIIFKGDN